jgi:hypothetical protein
MTAVLHPWHGASYGDKAPAQINGLVEIPQGSRAKYEVDKTTGLLNLTVLFILLFTILSITVSYHKRWAMMATRWIF